ncbi:hypothetical protein QYE76_028966 [Lolium multiflorum]|uniref:F-box domain-containing protein n=1 Tax=Lolium multiflorum TaxID=4521 RepID=A0AAD8QQI5_LOLMU|nr:hypothetical protein QYE76_028966 [Lolium multiflorum]
MSGGDRLSLLPDDLLRRVLHFSPAREGASTSALSKRWRGLWSSSGAVNLDARVPNDADDGGFFSRRDAFVSAARFSLEAAAAGSTVTRLTLRVEAAGGNFQVSKFMYHEEDYRRSTDVVAELLSHPAARRLEELRLAAEYSGRHRLSSDREVTSLAAGLTSLKFVSLPSETLRVLDITSCQYLQPSSGVVFPRLASLRLSHCSVRTVHLQDFVHVAPALATVRLESVMFEGGNSGHEQPPPEEGLTIRLHFPAATALVLDRCCWAEKVYGGSGGTTTVEMDAPRLRSFTYKGLLRRLTLSSQAPDLARVDLHIFPHVFYRDAGSRDLVTFWQLAQNFSSAKELKLRVNSLEGIAVVDKESQAELLCSFRSLERLELEGRLTLEENAAAASIANLLQCCPVLRDLRINLSTANASFDRPAQPGRCYLEKKYRHDLQNSIHGFKNRRTEPMVSDYDDDDAIYGNLPKLPALSGHVFHCLQSSLSCLRLQFRLETNIFGIKATNRFAVKLIEFFAENAMLLKEMHIDAGNGNMCGHINSKCRWRPWWDRSPELTDKNVVAHDDNAEADDTVEVNDNVKAHENGKANEEARCAELEALEAVEEWREAWKEEAAKTKLAAEEPLFGDFDWEADDDEDEHNAHEDEQDRMTTTKARQCHPNRRRIYASSKNTLSFFEN